MKFSVQIGSFRFANSLDEYFFSSRPLSVVNFWDWARKCKQSFQKWPKIICFYEFWDFLIPMERFWKTTNCFSFLTKMLFKRWDFSDSFKKLEFQCGKNSIFMKMLKKRRNFDTFFLYFQVIHFLLCKLDKEKSETLFRDCWPIFDKKMEAEFRRVCFNWYKELQVSIMRGSISVRFTFLKKKVWKSKKFENLRSLKI